jgi:hypothetical protein
MDILLIKIYLILILSQLIIQKGVLNQPFIEIQQLTKRKNTFEQTAFVFVAITIERGFILGLVD